MNFQDYIKGKLFLAPMENITEAPFRLICRKLGADIVVSEFISSEGLIRNGKKARDKLFYYKEEHPIGIQIFGGNENSLINSAKLVEEVNPDFIDINCGCWVKDVALRGMGAGLLRDLPKMKKLVESVVKNSKLPITVKTRLGWDQSSIVILEVAKMMEDIGVSALTVHCRLRSQANKGEADWSWIKRIKDTGIKLPIILNGNIQTPVDVKNAFMNYEPDAVMIGQAALKNPWIFKQSKYFMIYGELENEPKINEKIDICLEHLNLCVNLKGERKGVIEFRKYYTGYLRNIRNASSIRLTLMQYKEVKPIIEKLNELKREYQNVE
ncbi:MAG: tRNA-dihydrouridine synthase family protein [Ignavibacteria bacterium]|nr:tRNA-dihydrouridine synthase family protein [Ignavibacteria bacterium]